MSYNRSICGDLDRIYGALHDPLVGQYPPNPSKRVLRSALLRDSFLYLTPLIPPLFLTIGAVTYGLFTTLADFTGWQFLQGSALFVLTGGTAYLAGFAGAYLSRSKDLKEEINKAHEVQQEALRFLQAHPGFSSYLEEYDTFGEKKETLGLVRWRALLEDLRQGYAVRATEVLEKERNEWLDSIAARPTLIQTSGTPGLSDLQDSKAIAGRTSPTAA